MCPPIELLIVVPERSKSLTLPVHRCSNFVVEHVGHGLSLPTSAISLYLLSEWTVQSSYGWSNAPPLTETTMAEALDKCVERGDGLVAGIKSLPKAEMMAFQSAQMRTAICRYRTCVAEAAGTVKKVAVVFAWNVREMVDDSGIGDRVHRLWIVVTLIALWTWMTSSVSTRRRAANHVGGVDKESLLPVTARYQPLPQTDQK